MSRSDRPTELKFVATNTLIVGDIQRSVAFYRDVLGATVLREGEPTLPAARQCLAYYQPRWRFDRRQACGRRFAARSKRS
jgi:catechol 2,3-dioxygenase-like lactoylglutathione lyase family enzyme